MQLTFFGAFFVMASTVMAQLWNNERPNGITVKTLYVPMRKGSNSIPIPDFSKVRPLATLNLPNFSGNSGGDLQYASTLNQNYRPRVNVQESNIHHLQDVRAKTNHHVFKSDVHSQVSNIPNFNQVNNFHQQYNNPRHQTVAQTGNQHFHVPQQFYQPEPASNYVSSRPQSNVSQRNNYPNQNQNNGLPNVNIIIHDSHLSSTGNKIPNFRNPVNGHQIYHNDNIVVQRIPPSNMAYSQYQNSQNQLQQTFQRENIASPETISSSQSIEPNYPSESSRHFPQTPTSTTPVQQLYITTPTEAPSHLASHHQVNYIQNEQNSQHAENENHNTNPHQLFQNQDNRYTVHETNNQAQQPVNTYAIVHQRVPDNNFASQSNRIPSQSEQTYHKQTFDARSPTTHSSYVSSTQEQIPFPVASQNQIKIEIPQNSLDNSQYQMKEMVPVRINNQQYNGNPVTAHVQLVMSQFSQNQQGSHETQYFSQQQPSGASGDQNQDEKNSQSQNSMAEQAYPDPASETYYPENKQVYIAPPSDYSSQIQQPQPATQVQQQQSMSHVHQQQPIPENQYQQSTSQVYQQQPISQTQQQVPTREQDYVRYTSHIELNGQNSQIPNSMQTGQVLVPMPRSLSYIYQ